MRFAFQVLQKIKRFFLWLKLILYALNERYTVHKMWAWYSLRVKLVGIFSWFTRKRLWNNGSTFQAATFSTIFFLFRNGNFFLWFRCGGKNWDVCTSSDYAHSKKIINQLNVILALCKWNAAAADLHWTNYKLKCVN